MKNYLATFLLVACFGVLTSPLLASPAVLLSLVSSIYMLRERAAPILATCSHASDALKCLVICFGGWFAVELFSVLIHHDPIKEIDNAFRFLLAIGAFWIVVVTNNKRLDWVILGVVAGSTSAAGIAAYQHGVWGATRATGWANNPIYFGNLSILLTIIALVVLGVYRKALKPYLKNLLLFSLPLSLYASMASMSRSSFLALFSLLVMANFKQESLKRTLGYILMGMLAAILILQTYQHIVGQSRADETLKDVRDVQHGDYHGSVGQRLQMWKGSILIFATSPLIGIGSDAYQSRMVELKKNGMIDIPAEAERYNQPHSGIMEALAKRGIIGLIAYLSLFVLPYRLLRKLSHTEKPEVLLYCKLGQASIIAFFIFGLTDSIMGIQIYAVIYPMMVAILMALAINGQKQTENVFK
jgi:O-antigen ligase